MSCVGRRLGCCRGSARGVVCGWAGAVVYRGASVGVVGYVAWGYGVVRDQSGARRERVALDPGRDLGGAGVVGRGGVWGNRSAGGGFRVVRRAGVLSATGGGVSSSFTRRGVRVATVDGAAGLSLAGVGYGRRLTACATWRRRGSEPRLIHARLVARVVSHWSIRTRAGVHARTSPARARAWRADFGAAASRLVSCAAFGLDAGVCRPGR